MNDFTERILLALVEGYQARAGLKDRNRALTEYEIARRAGYTSFSYVEFSTTTQRDEVRAALDDLARSGWVSQWQRAGRYDSFVPTELGVRRAGTMGVVRDVPGVMEPPPAVPSGPAATGPTSAGASPPPAMAPEAALARMVEQLDEALSLLRAIDAKLGRDG